MKSICLLTIVVMLGSASVWRVQASEMEAALGLIFESSPSKAAGFDQTKDAIELAIRTLNQHEKEEGSIEFGLNLLRAEFQNYRNACRLNSKACRHVELDIDEQIEKNSEMINLRPYLEACKTRQVAFCRGAGSTKPGKWQRALNQITPKCVKGCQIQP